MCAQYHTTAQWTGQHTNDAPASGWRREGKTRKGREEYFHTDDETAGDRKGVPVLPVSCERMKREWEIVMFTQVGK